MQRFFHNIWRLFSYNLSGNREEYLVSDLSLGMVLTMLNSEFYRLPDLASLTVFLAVYEAAEEQGYISSSYTQRTIGRAVDLARQLGWNTQRHCLEKGLDQAVRYEFVFLHPLRNDAHKPV